MMDVFRWALAVIKEIEGLKVCVEDGAFIVGSTRYFTTDEVIDRAVRIFGGADYVI